MAADRLRLAGVFLLVVVVVVGGAAAIPLVSTEQTAPPATVDNPQFDPSSSLVDEAPEDGTIRMESDASGKTILIDAGHGNSPSADSIDPLVSTLVANGHSVTFFDPQANPRASLNASLREADAFLTISPTRRYSDGQLAGIAEFTEAGGRMVVLSDPSSGGSLGGLLGGLLGISSGPSGPATSGLSTPYGLELGAGSLYDIDSERNYAYINASGASGSLGAGVEAAVLRDAAPVVTGPNAQVALRSTPDTQRTTTRRSGEYAVAAQQGPVAVIGDTEFLTPDDAYRGDNEVLIGNLADFLVSGEKSPENAPAPPAPSGPGPGGVPTR